MISLSFRGKLILTLSIGSLALVAMCVVSLHSMASIEATYREVSEVDIHGKIKALEIAKDINFYSRLTRNIMLGSDYAKDMRNIDETIKRIELSFNDLGRTSLGPEVRQILKRAEDAALVFVREGRELLAPAASAPAEDRHTIYKEYEKKATPPAMAFREHFSAFDKAMDKRYLAATEKMMQDIQWRKWFLALSAATAICVVYAMGYLVTRRDLEAMRSCIQLAVELGKGETSHQVALESAGCMRELGEALNDTAVNLSAFRSQVIEAKAEAERDRDKAIQAMEQAEKARVEAERATSRGMCQAAEKLQEVVEVITSASEQLTAQIEQSSRGTQLQAERIGETASSMDEMTATVLEVAQNASQAAETSESARQNAQDGARLVENVVASIDTVQRQALVLKTDMADLGRQAESIGQVMEVISDIADQTNLLALNAAIEAARAGDAGRGFAVVADEVRKLAEKTMTATKEVGEAIRSIQNRTRINIGNVEASVGTIGQATDLAKLSGQSLRQIVSYSAHASDQVRSIATAAKEQSASTSRINRSIEDINLVSVETSEAMRQSAQAVVELSNQAQKLRGLIQELKAGTEAV